MHLLLNLLQATGKVIFQRKRHLSPRAAVHADGIDVTNGLRTLIFLR